MELAHQEAKLFVRDNDFRTKKITLVEFKNGTEAEFDLENEYISWRTRDGSLGGKISDLVVYLKRAGFNFAFWKRIMITQGTVDLVDGKLYFVKLHFYLLN